MSEIYNSIYFVTGGGTGGHIYPALAVADYVTHVDKGAVDSSGITNSSCISESTSAQTSTLSASLGAKVYYVGNKRNMEFELATKKGYKFLHVSVSGMPRKLNPKFFIWGIKLVKAIIRSIRYIKKYKPDAVFATGGYVSAPMIFACRITKTPYIMHDCDAMPGLVTRRLSKRAKYVTLAFEKAKRYIPNKHTVVTGNPIREEFETLTRAQAARNMGLDSRKLTLCIMGGSQGAKSINNTAVELIKEFSQELNMQIIFQTGKKNYDEVIENVRKIYPAFEQDRNIIIQPYFTDMISVLKSSDIVVSRAGSLSLSEICAAGAAPILIPYPYAAANHQRINAKYLLEMGACIYIEDKELDPNRLREEIVAMVNNPVKINYLKQNASHLAKFDATKRIVELLRSL